MKSIIYFISMVIISLSFIMTACVDEPSYSIITTIRTFELTPTTVNKHILVKKTDKTYDKDSIVFQWSRTIATNGTPVYYSVLFAGENGDFENPVYALSSNNIGWDDSLKIYSETLDLVAERCGIPSEGTGIIRWCVKGGNGVNSTLSSNESSFSVTRPKGIADYPVSLYMMGTATEAGDSVSKAIKGTFMEKGVFEFVTSLKPGNFYFINSKKEGAKTYQVTDGKIEFGKISVSPATIEQLYRIRLVLYNAEATIFEIQKMELIIPNKTSSNTSIPTEGLTISELDYKGNGKWEKLNIPGQKPDGSNITNGLQYKFRMTGKLLGSTDDLYFYYGYYTDSEPSINAGVPNNTSPESWYYCKETDTLDKGYYRFPNGAGGKKLNVAVYLTSGLSNYYHTCTIVEE